MYDVIEEFPRNFFFIYPFGHLLLHDKSKMTTTVVIYIHDNR